ncbi:MAG TPA: Holliday junction branch migration protein RuvA [Candidatus Woesebacteria bacterium]|nr:Holliday junction branch migration protein RuvA [Candidatus Woesebacteria bacterium]
MIAYLKGPVMVKDHYLIICCGGVGYQVYAPSKFLHSAVAAEIAGDELEAHIYTHVREDKLELYGFAQEQDLALFQLVLTVSGVGPKTALAIVDGGADQLITAVQEANLSFFTAVPRVGKKLAQKIVIELKSKLGSLKELNLATLSPKRQDVYDALLGLGFADGEINLALEKVDVDNLDLAEAIKQALKIAGGKKI